MKTGLDCAVCFYRQALNTARLSSEDPEVHYRVLQQLATLVPTLDLGLTPPENAVRVYALIADITGVADPYADLKRQSNDFVLSLRAQAEKKIAAAVDPLATAVRCAIGGNIIDYGVQHLYNEERNEERAEKSALASCLQREFALDEFARFKQELTGGAGRPEILYLADNCGEIVFDLLLVRHLLNLGCRVTMAVRGTAILNDATMADAVYCGATDLCPVIGNGTGCPGTPLASCTPELRQRFAAADLIVSKGQGNFETLSEVAAPIYFFLTVKCAVVAQHITAKRNLAPGLITGQGELVLMRQELKYETKANS